MSGYAIVEVKEILRGVVTGKMVDDLEDEIGMPSAEDFYYAGDTPEQEIELDNDIEELFF